MAKEVSEPWGKLEGKVVMVTGASSGLGLDFCLDLAKAGCKIVAAARRLDRLNSLCHQINLLASPDPESALASEPRCPRAVAVELDVCADASTIEQSVRTAWDAFGHIDALINNAGIRGNVKSPLELSEEEWNRVFKTNLTGTWLVSKYVCIRMRDARQGGSIINISSIAGLDRGQLPGAVAYASSKAGLNTMSKVMAMELGVYKIRVNSISPGLFRSEITQGLMQKDWLHNVAQKTVPLRTYGTADPALTSLVRYLIHDSSEYVSGNIFIVDAGATLPGVPIFSSL
ncbi:3-oxoacyl-[acyl-carrier-protein] reductase FabG [Morella rubra]|uniref:3-oxoacyl-[acyl-carrier-protein] reductase FabG n=1 Tax=Morella rubra TaxID=262757 RepID=A0A6A1WAB8_9ROSI|nr:3-oxoacyl-[acyl-carrier-protein] reductase FabG [Morella rubra]